MPILISEGASRYTQCPPQTGDKNTLIHLTEFPFT
jgi:hypothetical protein